MDLNRVNSTQKRGKNPIVLHKQDLLCSEEEVAADEVFPSGGGELVLHGEVEMAGKDGFEERFGLQVLNEGAGDGILSLELVFAIDVRTCVSERLVAVCPEAYVRSPDIISVERNVHTEDNRKPFGRFLLEKFDLLFCDISVNVVQCNEVHTLYNL